MISISAKVTSLRRAKAVSVITATPEAIDRLKKNDLPKKDVLTVAPASLAFRRPRGHLI
jgi:molybdenum cofactor biosynthesis enzyme